MRVLFDIGHPSFAHLFKNVAYRLLDEGHVVLFSIRNKDNTQLLLKELNLPSIDTGGHYKSMFGKLKGFILNTLKLARVARSFKPHLIVSGASPYASVVSLFAGIRHFVFDDTENREQVLLYKMGSNLIFTPKPFNIHLGKKHISYPGLHELAYLPGDFKRADKKDSPLIFFRFVAWNASHDMFRRGFTNEQKVAMVNRFKGHAEIVISSEPELPAALDQYAYKGDFKDVHSVLAGAALYIGESATMASEAACLNVPAFYFDPVGRSYTRMLEQSYGLVFNGNFTENAIDTLMDKAIQVLRGSTAPGDYKRFLSNSIDVSSFLYWLMAHASDADLKGQLNSNDFFKQFSRSDRNT